MQIYFDATADVSNIRAELNDHQTDTEADDEPRVAANDNTLRWPLIPFPEGWYAAA